jgi:hypothetical protein
MNLKNMTRMLDFLYLRGNEIIHQPRDQMRARGGYLSGDAYGIHKQMGFPCFA